VKRTGANPSVESVGAIADADIPSSITRTIAVGTATLGTTPIGANACAAAVQPTASTGSLTTVASTDTITWTPNADISGVTGYGKAGTDGLIIYPFASAGAVNFTVCNGTGTGITPGAVSLDWKVIR
jgi:hypothetical protein